MDIETALLDKQIFTLRVVGRKHLSAEALWRLWMYEG